MRIDLFNAKDRDLDLWYWLAEPRGVFSVRSYYKLMTYDANNSSSSVWRCL